LREDSAYSRVSKAAICIATDQERAFLAPLRALQCDNVLAEPAIPINRPQQGSASLLAQPIVTVHAERDRPARPSLCGYAAVDAARKV